jgi:hypothetical protein
MSNAIGESLSNHASSDDRENWEDEDADREDSKPGKLSQDDEPGWDMDATPKIGHHSIERVR